MDTEDRDEYDGLTVLRQRIVQYSWKQVKHLLGEQCQLGIEMFKHIFDIEPAALQLFPFKNQKNYMQSAQLKKHATGVIGTIGRAIESIDNLTMIIQVLKALGIEHETRNIT